MMLSSRENNLIKVDIISAFKCANRAIASNFRKILSVSLNNQWVDPDPGGMGRYWDVAGSHSDDFVIKVERKLRNLIMEIVIDKLRWVILDGKVTWEIGVILKSVMLIFVFVFVQV